MTIEEELVSLREENKALREQLAQRDELIQQQQALLAEQSALIQHHGEQMSRLSEQVKSLRDRLSKDSHNSHLPPSSDRFGRKAIHDGWGSYFLYDCEHAACLGMCCGISW